MDILSFLPKIYMPRAIFFGNKAISFFKTIKEAKNFLIVSKHCYDQNKEFFEGTFGASLPYLHSGEPTNNCLDNLLNEISKEKYENLICVGGGSVIDLAKLAQKESKIPLTVMPSTLGSGSEVSQYSILNIGNKKIVKFGKELLPDTVILNPDILKSLTVDDIVYEATDVLAHSIESYVSRMANPFSQQLAVIAINLVFEFLPKMDLEQLQIASTLAGMAQSSASTGLCHAFAHVIGPKQKIPHAHLIATFLIDTIKLNLNYCDKYKKLDINLIEKLDALYKKMAIKSVKIAFEEGLAEEIRKDVNMLSNPCKPSAKEIQTILENHL